MHDAGRMRGGQSLERAFEGEQGSATRTSMLTSSRNMLT